MSTPLPRIALHLEDGKRRILGVLAERLALWHFVRIHRSHVVNPLLIREVRHQKGSEDRWEVKLATLVNRVLPVGEKYLAGLWLSLGET